MKAIRVQIGLFLMIVAASAWAGEKGIPADGMGLSRETVFNVPEQKVYQEMGGAPGSNKRLPRAYLNAPPQIPHDIGDFLPITAQSNFCMACHNQPGLWDKKREKGTPTPMPRSHYTDLRHEPGKLSELPINARFNCNQCHVPQTNASPLVENTFTSKSQR